MEELLKLWLVTRTDHWGYEDFDAVVVVALTEEQALHASPSGPGRYTQDTGYSWTPNTKDLSVKLLGYTDDSLLATLAKNSAGSIIVPQPILASFNAG